MQVDGLQAGGNGAGSIAESAGGTGNLAEQAVGAALRYRAYAPVLDKLLQEVGLADQGIAGLVAASPVVTSEASTTPKLQPQPGSQTPTGKSAPPR
jgi:hypothetical protein